MAKSILSSTRLKPKQINNYKISFSKTYGKWQVSKLRYGKKVVLEEFDLKQDAIKFAKNN